MSSSLCKSVRGFFGGSLVGEGEVIRIVRFCEELPLDTNSEPLLGVKGAVFSNLKLMSLTMARAIAISKRYGFKDIMSFVHLKSNKTCAYNIK
jgi:hypothetical protein